MDTHTASHTKDLDALRNVVRLMLEGSIDRGIDYIAQETTFRVYGPKGWTDHYEKLEDALREGGFNGEADAVSRSRV